MVNISKNRKLRNKSTPNLLILNQMAGPMTWELAEDLAHTMGPVALLTGHPDTLAKGETDNVWMYKAAPYVRNGLTHRTISWLRYSWQAFWWIWSFPRQTPLLLFSNPPILCWLGWLIQVMRGQCYAVMVHDIYPDTLVALNQVSSRHWLVRLWRMLNQKAYTRAQLVMTLSEGMAKKLETQLNQAEVLTRKIEVVYPWVDTAKIRPIPKEQNYFAQKHCQIDKMTIMYSGNMGLGHDIETMIDTARILQDEPRVQFMFIGAGPKWQMVQTTLEEEKLQNIVLLPWQPEDGLAEQLATADLGLVSLEDSMRGLAMPSKALYMISAGAPLLAIASGQSDLQQLVEGNNCGILIPPARSDLLADTIRNLLHNTAVMNELRSSARKTATDFYDRKTNTKILFKYLKRLCDTPN